jgi:hypothetical protein
MGFLFRYTLWRGDIQQTRVFRDGENDKPGNEEKERVNVISKGGWIWISNPCHRN